jgi:hypothetical protein
MTFLQGHKEVRPLRSVSHICTSNSALTSNRHSIDFAYAIALGDEGDHDIIDIGIKTAQDFGKDEDESMALVSNPHGRTDDATTPCLSDIEQNVINEYEIDDSSVPHSTIAATGMFSMRISMLFV